MAVTIPGGEVTGSYAPRENPLVQVETQHLPTKIALQSGIAGPSHFGSPTGASFAHQPIDTKSRSTRPFADVPLSTSSVPRKRQRGESVTPGNNPVYAAQEQIPTPVSAPGATLRNNASATGKNQSHAQRLDPSGHLTHQLVNRKSMPDLSVSESLRYYFGGGARFKRLYGLLRQIILICILKLRRYGRCHPVLTDSCMTPFLLSEKLLFS